MFSCEAANETASVGAHVGCACHSTELRSIARRIDRELSRRGFVAGVGASLAALGFAPRAAAQASARPPHRLHKFPAVRRPVESPARRRSILVEGGRIKAVATTTFPRPMARRSSIAADARSCRG